MAMNAVNLLSLFLSASPPPPSEDTRQVLRNYPGCGQLGDPGKKECFWGCEYAPSPFWELNETSILALIEDKLGELVGGKAASCLFGTGTDFTDYTFTYNKEQNIIVALYRIIREFVVESQGPVSVKSPACLKNCGMTKSCSTIVEEYYIPFSDTDNGNSDILTEYDNDFLPISFSESLYGPDCVLELEVKITELANSGMLQKITEEVAFHNCLWNYVLVEKDLLDYFLFGNCITALFSENSASCYQKQRKKKGSSKQRSKDAKKETKKQRKKKGSSNRSQKGLRTRLNHLRNTTRLIGGSTDIGPYTVNQERYNNTLHQYPWLCSLRTRGFRGYHQCGVTLLSAPPQKTVLVSAAHCNFLCKDDAGYPVETCCCRDITEPNSCIENFSFCGRNASLQLARAEDLNIVCSEWDIGQVNEKYTPEQEVVLTVKNFKNHELFNISEGPVGGHDIAVYFVDEEPLRKEGTIKKGVLYPACLPSRAHKSKSGIFAGWRDPDDIGLYFNSGLFGYTTSVDQFRSETILRHVLLTNSSCRDPDWMGSDSLYPEGTICATDPSMRSCFDTGDSGSGLLMERFQGGYSWEGVLSSYRGCRVEPVESASNTDKFTDGFFVGENPGVFTEGSCYLEWIADSYGLQLGQGYSTGCRGESGDKEDVDSEICMASNGKQCLLNIDLGLDSDVYGIYVLEQFGGFSQCVLGGQLDLSMTYTCATFDDSLIEYCCSENENSKQCEIVKNTTVLDQNTVDTYNQLLDACGFENNLGRFYRASCANNCPGVKLSDIVVGGTAIVAAATISTLSVGSFLPALLGLGLGVVGLGAGGLMLVQNTCQGPLYCVTTGGSCCLLANTIQGLVCPDFC